MPPAKIRAIVEGQVEMGLVDYGVRLLDECVVVLSEQMSVVVLPAHDGHSFVIDARGNRGSVVGRI
jgi:hypothetical protein